MNASNYTLNATDALTARSPSLTFAKSESKMVGAQGKAIDIIKKYALRAAGWLKVPTFLSVIYAGINPPNPSGLSEYATNPFRITAGAIMLSTVMILALFGKKKDANDITNEQKALAERIESHGWAGEIEKVLHFKEYPIETAGALGVAGGIATIFSGLFGAPNLNPIEVALGCFGGMASIFLWLSKDSKKENMLPDETDTPSLTFARSESKSVGFANGFGKFIKEEILGKPVRTASMLFLCASALQLGIGFDLAGSVGKTDIGFIMAGAFSGVANILSLLFVRKSDYNIEQDGTESAQPDTTITAPKEKTETLARPEMALGAV